MSLRHIRKVFGGTELPPPESSDEEYEPSYTQNHKKELYAGLEVSESDSENAVSDEATLKEAQAGDIKKKKSNKRNKKKQRKTQKTLDVDSKAYNELDEIDRTVLEINAQYGEPSQPPVEPKATPFQIQQNLFSIRQYFLDPDKEMDRRFGPDPDEDSTKKRGRQPNLRIISQKSGIIKTEKIYKRNGLSMNLKCQKNDLTFFTFYHGKEYQQMHKMFLIGQSTENQMLFPFPESQKRLHVEGMLEVADRLYMTESYGDANKVIETIISFMEQSAHINFSVTNIRVRLEYKYLENRAFHIALLKYAYLLTNKGCHRTALEISKILLNLDPSDPLAVLFVIDTIAIRAGEYQWIIEAIDHWNEDRDAKLLFNLQYSYALARFHILRKKKDGFEEADALLMNAMKMFPAVVTYILRNADMKNKDILESPLFDPQLNKSTENLNVLMDLYTKYIWNKFTEEPTRFWLIRNATELARQYAQNEYVKIEAGKNANVRKNLFQVYPQEMMRHLSVIKPLAGFIVDGELPDVPRMSFDPFPPADGVNIYQRLNPTEILIENLRMDPYFQEVHDRPWVPIAGRNVFTLRLDDDFSDFDVEEDETMQIINEMRHMQEDPFFSVNLYVPTTHQSDDEQEYSDLNAERGTGPQTADNNQSQAAGSEDEKIDVTCDDSEEEVPTAFMTLPKRSTPFYQDVGASASSIGHDFNCSPRNNSDESLSNEMKALLVSVAEDVKVADLPGQNKNRDEAILPVCKDPEIESETGLGTSCESVTKPSVGAETKTGKDTNDKIAIEKINVEMNEVDGLAQSNDQPQTGSQ